MGGGCFWSQDATHHHVTQKRATHPSLRRNFDFDVGGTASVHRGRPVLQAQGIARKSRMVLDAMRRKRHLQRRTEVVTLVVGSVPGSFLMLVLEFGGGWR